MLGRLTDCSPRSGPGWLHKAARGGDINDARDCLAKVLLKEQNLLG
jgi:hypothetical protein